MKITKSFLILFFTVSLAFVSFPELTNQKVFAQDVKIAIQRGYRTGYSDGYMAGYRDSIDNAAKNFSRHSEYGKADRAYLKDYGAVEDYRDGYQQGFESGYETGFEKRSFDATIPPTLAKRGVIVPKNVAENAPEEKVVETQMPIVLNKPAENDAANKTVQTVAENAPQENAPNNNVVNQTNEKTPGSVVNSSNEDTAANDQNKTAPPVEPTQPEYVSTFADNQTPILIPVDTELIIELLGDINTEKSSVGDKFQARIVSPNELNGAIIEGRISKIQTPGRIKRRAQLLLSFDRIILTENRWSNFNAILTEVLPIKGDNVKRVDTEGTVEGKSSVKSDSIKIGATTGAGLVIGAVTGGPVGAVVGAGVGAAFGVGAVVVERGKHVRLGKNQQLRIKTAYETQIR